MTSKTNQEAVWDGDFGAAYTERNTFDLAGLEDHYLTLYGVGRRAMNDDFVGDLDRASRILEVGCNTGNQLLCLRDMGFEDLTAVELQDYAITRARARLPGVEIRQASAFELPFADASFDLVYTSGVLIHIAPTDLPRVMAEIHRVAQRCIWGFEYYEQDFAEIPYRGHATLMWKGPYARAYLDTFDDLKLLREQRYGYVADDNEDAMFLLEKRGSGRGA